MLISIYILHLEAIHKYYNLLNLNLFSRINVETKQRKFYSMFTDHIERKSYIDEAVEAWDLIKGYGLNSGEFNEFDSFSQESRGFIRKSVSNFLAICK